jgi:hypothetical protein
MLTITILTDRNIFDSQCQTIVNTINCVGVMGKGLSLEMKNRYPSMFEKYKEYCNRGLIDIGSLWLYKHVSEKEITKRILNFPTKKDWRNKSEYEYIEKGMEKFINTYKEKGITSIAFPEYLSNMEGHVFNCCSSLTTVIIPNSVISLYDGAFNACTALRKVTISDIFKPNVNKIFSNCYDINYTYTASNQRPY